MVHCVFRGVIGCIFFNVFLSLMVIFILANSVDPNEMPHYAVFYSGFNYLPKYAFIVTSIYLVL